MTKQKNDAERMLQQAYHLQDDADTQAFYSNWAESYDATMVDDLDYLTPGATSELIANRLTDMDAAILDIGCGTGLAGAELAQRGYRVIDGLDFSEQMLAVARKRGVYRELIQADLNQPLEIETAQYRALICTGTFTHAHVGADSLDELFRILQAGGLFACTVHKDVWEPAGFADKVRALQSAGTVETLIQRPGPYFAGSSEADGDFILWCKTA